MTQKEFYQAVIGVEGINEELITYATEAIAKLDAKNAKKRDTASKAQLANIELGKAVVEFMAENGPAFASDIAGNVDGITSTQKATAVLKLLVADGTVTVEDVKVKGKGSVKQYTLTATTEAAE